jgi:hypothetical protein
VECWESVWGKFPENSSKQISNCDLDLVAEQEVRWSKGGSQVADGLTFLYGNEMRIVIRDGRFRT